MFRNKQLDAEKGEMMAEKVAVGEAKAILYFKKKLVRAVKNVYRAMFTTEE